jgi:hypothetical protein
MDESCPDSNYSYMRTMRWPRRWARNNESVFLFSLSLSCVLFFSFIYSLLFLFFFSHLADLKSSWESEREKNISTRALTLNAAVVPHPYSFFCLFFLLPRPIEANYSRDHFSAVRGVTRGCINRDQYHYIYYIRYLYPSTTSKGAITKRKGNWRETRWGGKRRGFLIGQAPCR